MSVDKTKTPIVVIPGSDAEPELLELANLQRGMPRWFASIPPEMLDANGNYWTPWLAALDSTGMPDIVSMPSIGILYIGY